MGGWMGGYGGQGQEGRIGGLEEENMGLWGLEGIRGEDGVVIGYCVYLIIMYAESKVQNYKKQGLDQAQNQFLCSQKGIFLRGLPKHLIINPKVDLTHLTCQICHNLPWKPVTCSQPNCFANFCTYCVSNLPQQNPRLDYDYPYPYQQFQQQPNQPQPQLPTSIPPTSTSTLTTTLKCPKCTKIFQKTSIPLVNSLLSDLQLRCLYVSEGCGERIGYEQYLKHCLGCQFRRVCCQGCRNGFLQKFILEHKRNCSKIVVGCPKCGLQLPQADFKVQHNQVRCLQEQLQKKTNCVMKLQDSIQKLKLRLNQYQNLMSKIIKGDNLQLAYELYSSFPTNFMFIGSSSWNASKQKYDFLHFYVTSRIKTESPIGFQWKLHIKVLKGNLLIGICSSLLISSVDFVINRFGQIKKKESAENKYKLIRKGNLTFSEGDTISFKYLALRKVLKIQNQTKKVQCKLETKEIQELGENLYSFYSLDTVNDTIKFI